MTPKAKLAAYLMDHTESLSMEIVESVIQTMGLRIPEEEKNQAIAMYIELLGFLGKSIVEDHEEVPEDLLIWSKKNAHQQAAAGGEISEIAVRYPPTRGIFNDLLTKLSKEFGLSVEENAFIIKRVNRLLDVSLNETIFAFEKLTEQYKEKTQKEMAELSAPVVLIKEGVVVLPLIGVIDSYRARYILDKVVPKISELQVDFVITDCSGLLKIDTEIVSYLRQLSEVLQLLGINAILTGLRPELTQFIVNSGIDMSSIITFAHVKQALESIG